MRDMIGARLVGSTYAERWLVVDAIVKGHDVRQITFDCDPRRPRVELPAVGDRVRWEFMQLPGENEEELNNEAKIRLLVQQYKKYRAFQIERKAVYTFHARVADRWRRDRVFLAGDAAHLMPPFAGQGMNGGMKDAVNLAWKLAAVLKGQAQEAILDTYEVERAPVVRQMVEVSRRLGAVIMPTNPIIAAARDLLFAGLNLSGRFRAFIGRGGLVPPPRVRQSALTASGRDPLIGQMMPQPEVGPAARRALLDTHLTCHQWLAARDWRRSGFASVAARSRKSSTRSGLASCASTGAQRMREPPPIACADPAVRGLGQAPPSARRAGAAGPLHRRAPRSERRPFRPGALFGRSGVQASPRRLTLHLGSQTMPHRSAEHRTRQHRTEAQPSAPREGGQASVRPFRAPRSRQSGTVSD